MSLAYVTVDVFADTPLQGNQLAVPEDGSALSDDQMQRRARETNHSGQRPARGLRADSRRGVHSRNDSLRAGWTS